MIVEFLELNDNGMPAEAQKTEVTTVPRIGELIAFGDNYFEVVNVIHYIRPNIQEISIFARPAKRPYVQPKSRFGFGGR